MDGVAGGGGLLKRWAYAARINDFLNADPQAILGALAQRSVADVTHSDRSAWFAQIQVLKRELAPFRDRGNVYFEYHIPRIGKRIDNVVLVDHAVFVVEFKTGDQRFTQSSIEQVWDYALDLKYFQSACRDVPIIPMLVASGESSDQVPAFDLSSDCVAVPLRVAPTSVSRAITFSISKTAGPVIDPNTWEAGRYFPAPTIVEAARALYANHNVADVTRSGADASNIQITSKFLSDRIEEARSNQKKIICFVTGVPGAGKTLVGLDIAAAKSDKASETHSVFLSGNAPLVKVLQEALARDEVVRSADSDSPVKKGDALRRVKAFIQIVHHFRDECLADPNAPPKDHVAIFDEAQRAWDLRKTAAFMAQKKGLANFPMSEPEFLIDCLDRHKDWAAVVCLVGNGQEINDGEAGIAEWLRSVGASFPSWEVYLSEDLAKLEPNAMSALQAHPVVCQSEALHLQTSVRSFRSAKVSQFANQLLALEMDAARCTLKEILPDFPIVVTRDLEAARAWLRRRARGSERTGLVVSSGAQRLRPLGIDVRVAIDPIHWFLNDREDVRSSSHLEDVATEFQAQGLELDWVGVVWDADLRYDRNSWSYHNFSGTTWKHVRKGELQNYLLNAYRVLLTRARQGMCIAIPHGHYLDRTRNPAHYQGVYELLRSVGVPELRDD